MTMNNEFKKLISGAQEVYSLDPSSYGKYNVKKGLRNADGTGVLVGLTGIGDVHGYIIKENEKIPDDGLLRYRGYDLYDIVSSCRKEKRFGYEEVAFLLLLGHLPNDDELAVFKTYIHQKQTLPFGFTEDMILKAPSNNIMNKLARSVLALYSYDEEPDNNDSANIMRQSVELIARFGTLIAYGYQAKSHYYDGKSLIIHTPQKGLSLAENFLYMMRPDNKFTAVEAEVLDTALMIHAEHGGGNNSSFATRVVSSSGTDTYSAIAAGVGSLKGHKHGGANTRVSEMMDCLKENVSDINNEGEIADFLTKVLKKEAYDKSGLVYGMGHAIYTLSDPRAVLLKKEAERLAKEKGMEKEFKMYSLIEELTPELFEKVTGKNKVMCANVDLYSGLVYSMLGIPREVFTPIFAMSRVAGWCAHRIEEMTISNKIIRPAYKNVLQEQRYLGISER